MRNEDLYDAARFTRSSSVDDLEQRNPVRPAQSGPVFLAVFFFLVFMALSCIGALV